MTRAAVPAELPSAALRAVVERVGTPAYAYDLARVRSQLKRVEAILPARTSLLYSLKANPSLGICCFMAAHGLGADVASAGELATSLAAGIAPHRTFIAAPHLAPDLLERLRGEPEAVLSIDSPSELERLAREGCCHRVLLRLRPDFEIDAVVDAGAGSRFGIRARDLERCRRALDGSLDVVGFHIYSGSQILDAGSAARHLRGAFELARRAGERLAVTPRILNLGGGFGVPYTAADDDLELAPVAEELASIRRDAGDCQLVLELGRYLVAQAGWYLTTVVAEQTHRGRPAVVVDGGSHQRADLCGLGLRVRATPPIVLAAAEDGGAAHGGAASTQRTDVLGCLCLPDDVLAEESLLPPLPVGAVLAFPNAGAYGLSASPQAFLGHPVPAEVAFEGPATELLRPRPSSDACLAGQRPLGIRAPSS